MAIALIPEICEESACVSATVTLAVLCSPIKAADGSWRIWRTMLPCAGTVAAILQAYDMPMIDRVIVNGRTLSGQEQQETSVCPGDELLLIPRWGVPAVLVPLLVTFAIGLAVSVAATGLSYLLFPPQKPHLTAPDEATFSWEGIRTAIGPGAVIPVIYGRHRVGGQLLSASIDQAMTVLDFGQPSRSLTAIATPPTLTMLIALGEGPIRADQPPPNVEINGQPLANFPGVTTDLRLGTPDQTAMAAFGEIRNTFADGREIPVGEILYTTTTPVQGFVLNIVFNEGLYHFTSDGNKEDNSVTIQYFYQEGGHGWNGPLNWDISAARTSPVRLGIRREQLGLSVYEIRIGLVGVKNQNEQRDRWKPTLESVTEVIQNTETYPGTALLGLRTVATNALQGALPNITMDVYGRTVRVGSFSAGLTWSDNPAWCMMDFLTNTRYGLGIPDAEIDLAAFATWAAYCDQIIDGERRHTFNYVLDRDSRAQPALLEMQGASRTLIFKSEGLWTPRPTRDDPPVQLLSWANCSDLKLTYTRDVDRINVMEARFANEDNGYQQDVLTWPTLDNWPADVRKASMEIRGVTKPSRIMRALQFELNRRRFETLQLECTCALDALVLQPHDLFRFSHPLPGWGVSGRLQAGSTTTMLLLDETVTFVGAQSYLVYVRYENDAVEMRPVIYFGDGESRVLALAVPLTTPPPPRTTLYAFGALVGPADSATKVFRVVNLRRTSTTTLSLQAVIHNPSIYDEPNAEPLPVTTLLFNPLGPPPALTSLILTEVTRIQPSGASLHVVNISWDVAPLTAGFAPYGGAMVFRRTVLAGDLAGIAAAGVAQAGVPQQDANLNYAPLFQVSGHVLDFDDYTVMSQVSYVYRVVPISQRGVPNELGAREAFIHIAGPTTPDFFPSTVLNLRLLGKAVGVTEFDGPDIHLAWDPVPPSPLFSQTFFVQDYIVQVWRPGQLALLRQVTVPTGPPGQTVTWTYTLQQNAEDHVRQGIPGAQRTIQFLVYARTNTGRMSLDPAQITVTNPPPDMSMIAPEVQGLFAAGLVDYNQFAEPRDFDHYEVHLDTVNPPIAIYQDVSIAFEKLFIGDLIAGATYYVYILPYDTFGPGLPSQIASFTPVAIDADSLDTVPPALPTGLSLTTGTTISADGTIMPWVRAQWTANAEGDMARYEVHFRVAPSSTPTVFTVAHPTTSIRLENVAGNTTVFARMLALDKFANASPFTAEVSITTSTDTIAPATPTNLTAFGSFRAIALLWTPPPDLDYVAVEAWASLTNNRLTANKVGESREYLVHDGVGTGQTWYYWFRAKDSSGNVSAFVPAQFAGLSATSAQAVTNDLVDNIITASKVTTGELITTGAQIRDAIITNAHISSLSAGKITTGSLAVLVAIGVANRLFLDGVNGTIVIADNQATPATRVVLGKLGTLSTDYGLVIYNAAGQIMWHFSDGAQTPGIADNAITAQKITAATIASQHLRTDTAVITTAAQIANALITDAHISNLSAEKIMTGTLTAELVIGVGARMFLRGPYEDLLVYDNQSTPQLRVLLGNLAAMGTADYGLQIYNGFGQKMWDFNSGAQTPGIAPAAVVTNTVATNAITESVLFGSSPAATTDGTATEFTVAAIAFGGLLPGDQVLLTFKALGQLTDPGADAIECFLRENNTGAFDPLLDYTIFRGALHGTLVVQWVYTVGAPIGFKAFHVGFRNPLFPFNPVSLSNKSLVGLLRRR
jgi:predicted phage tail protein